MQTLKQAEKEFDFHTGNAIIGLFDNNEYQFIPVRLELNEVFQTKIFLTREDQIEKFKNKKCLIVKCK